jgi:16S rRNA U516 pseudouridylate synthase RsuA-like enzyme
MSKFNKQVLPSKRVQKLLEGEKSHFEKEIEHERVVNQQCAEDDDTAAQAQDLKVCVQEEEVQLPSRAISISVF